VWQHLKQFSESTNGTAQSAEGTKCEPGMLEYQTR
jgi:hypothetical protein